MRGCRGALAHAHRRARGAGRSSRLLAGHVCPGIRIHAIDIVQPPGIGISPIADMDVHQRIVAAALAAKSSAETPKRLAEKLVLKPCVANQFPRMETSVD